MTDVVLDRLARRYGAETAVNVLSLEIASGERVALPGPSGGGKSTTLRMIAGLLPPTSGEVFFDGRPMTAVPGERRGAVMMFQNHRPFPHMTVAENVGFARRKVEEMLARVDLDGFANRRPSQLSGGQAQRVALARALVAGPRSLLLDEPLSSLDVNLRQDMRTLIRRIHDDLGITTIFVTHDQGKASVMADRIALLLDGNLQQYAAPRDFFHKPVNTATARFFGCGNFLSGTRRGGTVDTPAGTLHIDPSLPGPDGKFIVTIRPESLRIADSGSCAGNLVPAEILSTVFQGTSTELTVSIGGSTWRIIAGSDCDLQLERASMSSCQWNGFGCSTRTPFRYRAT